MVGGELITGAPMSSKFLTPERRKLAGQVFRYLFNGGLNTVIGLSLIFFFMHVVQLSPQLSNFIAYAITLFTSFFLHKRFTFKSKGNIRRELALFFLVYWLSYFGNLGSLSLLLHWKVQPGIAQILSSAVFVVVSFILQRVVIFSRQQVQVTPDKSR